MAFLIADFKLKTLKPIFWLMWAGATKIATVGVQFYF